MKSIALFRYLPPVAILLAGVVLGAMGMRWLGGSANEMRRDLGTAEPATTTTWSELEDANVATFAQNLRSIGCPEAVIRRIVVGDPEPQRASAAPLAVQTAPEVPVSAAPALVPQSPRALAPQDTVIVAPEGRVPLPVAFQPLPQDVRMTAPERALLSAIQDDFIAAIGGPNQIPSSPEYQDRWRKAQRRSDELFKVAFGELAFIQRQMAMLQQAAPARQPGS